MATKTFVSKRKRNCHAYYISSTGVVEQYNSSVNCNSTSSVTYGPNVKNFRQRIAQGLDATTGLSGVRYNVKKWKPGVSENRYTTGIVRRNSGYWNSGNIPYLPSPIYTPLPQAVTEAETNFAKSYRKVTQVATMGVSLGELTEAARLLANPVKSLRGLTDHMAHDVRRIKRLWKSRKDGGQNARHSRNDPDFNKAYRTALSDIWLTYQFGARPLASEANDAMTAIRALEAGRTYELRRVYGTGSFTKHEGTIIGTVNVTSGGAPAEGELRTTLKTDVFIRGAIRIDGEIPPLTTFGLSVLDIVPTAWELIPFSFLVDYFTNAGNTLDALMLRYVDFSWLNQTVRNSRMIESCSYRPYKPTTGYTSRTAFGGDAQFITTTISRAPRDNNFGGGLTFQAPGLGSLKWINIGALMQTINASRPR